MPGERILGVGYNTVGKGTVRLARTEEKNCGSPLFHLEIKQTPHTLNALGETTTALKLEKK